MNIYEFLVWLTAGGGAMAASWILESMQWFQALQAGTKKWTYFGVCLALSVGAYVTQTYVPAEILEQLAPYFVIVSSTFGTVFLGTGYHKLTKSDKSVG